MNADVSAQKGPRKRERRKMTLFPWPSVVPLPQLPFSCPIRLSAQVSASSTEAEGPWVSGNRG